MHGNGMYDDEPWDWDDDRVPIQECGGDVFYDPRTNRFLQIREQHTDRLVCGDFSEYFNDAKTNIRNQMLPLEYLDGLKKVESPGDLEEAEYDADVLAWRVKGEARDTVS